MNRLVRRQRAALALFIALTVSGVGVALADPQTGDQPGVTLDVSPTNGQNLPATANITVTGAGFAANNAGVSGILVQSAELANGTTALSPTLGNFTSNSQGTFSSTIPVTRTFTATGSGTLVDCGVVQCYVEAFSTGGNFNSRHTISFTGGTVTTATSTTSSTVPTTTSSTMPTTTSSSTTSSSTTSSSTTSSSTSSSTTSSTTSSSTTSSSTSSSTTSSTMPTTTSSSTTSSTAPTTTSSSTTSSTAPTTTSSSTTSTTIGGGPTTTVLGASQCAQLRAARTRLNGQVNAARAAIIQAGLPPQQRAAALAKLEATRARGNAQLDALLAGCPS